MLESPDRQSLEAGQDELLLLRLDRTGAIRHASPAVMRMFGDGLAAGRSIADGGMLLTEEQRRALLGCQGTWTCKTSLLRGAAPPIGATLVAMPGGEELSVLLTVDVGELFQLQEALGAINSQLTNLNRERVKAKSRLERALQDVEEKNQLLQAMNEELQTLNEELEMQTEALQQAHDYAEALTRENMELHQLDQLKNQFIGIISHELKTPLNFVTGFTSILADEVLGPLNERQVEAMEKVLSGASRLDLLINELLDANKLQAGRLDVAPEAVDLPALIGALLEEMRPMIALKELRLAAPPSCPAQVWADPLRLHQVLRNLLSNAIKFTPARGALRVEAEACEGAAGARVRLCVSDTGIGIPAEAIGRLFEPFYQVDSSTTREYGGTGLGLSIVKSLVELMDGEVGVESALGSGSTFWFTLPVARPQPAP